MQHHRLDVAAPTEQKRVPHWRRVARDIAAGIAEHEVWLLAFIAPILVIAPSPLLPSWLVTLALLAIPIPFLARRVAYGYFSVNTPQEVPLLLLLAMHVVGAVVTVDMGLTILVVKRTALAVAIFFFLVNAITRQEQVAWVVAMLVGAGLIIGAVGLVGTNWSTGKLLPLQALFARLPHTVFAALNAVGFNANIVGGSLAMIVPVAIGLAAVRNGWSRVLCLLASAVLLGVVVLSQSRGALLGLTVALGIMAVAADRRFLWLVPIAAGVGAIAWLRFGPQTMANLLLPMEGSGGTFESRLELWQRATYMIQDFAYTGIGSGTFSRVLPILYPPFLAPPDAVIPHAHQMYLQFAVDFGLPGFVAAIALLTTLFLVGIDSIRQIDRSTRWLAVGLFAGFTVYLVHGFMDDITFSTKAAAVLWVIAGLMVGQWRLARRAVVLPERDAVLSGIL